MKYSSLNEFFTLNLKNIPGWKSDRKIVVIESDDWGSIRMPSLNVFNNLFAAGIDESNCRYNLFDSLESNKDLELLFEVLTKHKDINGNSAVFTTASIVANPDFGKIKAANFSQYFFEPYTETLQKYPEHDKVYGLTKEGIQKRLFVPVFHGREHLNIQRWMKALQAGHKSTMVGFENRVTGITNGINHEIIPSFQAALDIDDMNDISSLKVILSSGLNVFEELFGYKSEYFVPPNGLINNSLNPELAKNGIKYIYSDIFQKEPLGNGKYKRNIRFLGQNNISKLTYLTRNCVFEPSSSDSSSAIDWIDICLLQIQTAFRWGKPAVISSHRVNYIGSIQPLNRERNLIKLNRLLGEILKKWPTVEFMTSVELGDLISNNKI